MPAGAENEKICFVIMPFGERAESDGEVIDFDEVYEYLIKEVVENVPGLRAIRCDKIPNAGSIHRDMIEHIHRADLAIVDITTLSANVFYELGIRHSLRPSGTILIRKKGTRIPFNIRPLRIVEYALGLKESSQAKQSLRSFVDNALDSPRVDSTVYEVFPNLRMELP